MTQYTLKPELLSIDELFGCNSNYTIPVYQRNYAWQYLQIEQLISDIQDSVNINANSYFIGNLVVTLKISDSNATEKNFEVIDGQQRLTTLYLLLTFLEKEGDNPYAHHKGRLQYESRARASETLRRIGQDASVPAGQQQDSLPTEDSGIHEGFKVIQQVMQHETLRDKEARGQFADFLRTKVTVVRASLPPQTDLNRYFEIMNTRGRQLNQVDIVKARLMSKLPLEEHATFAWVWDACADMDTYVQMTLTRGNTDLRDTVFGADWSWLQARGFPTLVGQCPQKSVDPAGVVAGLSLDAALHKYASTPTQGTDEDEGNERFRSPIEFPVFLLHVLKVKKGSDAEDEGQLDDKHLIQAFSSAMTLGQDPVQWVRDFAFTLLKCRNLFDSFILKRQFLIRNEEGDGEWSLQRLKKRTSNNKPMPGYIHVFSKTEQETEEGGQADVHTRDVLWLQSMLRITYTSPRTMHWITKVLQALLSKQKPEDISSSDIADLLRSYARSKVLTAFFGDVQPQSFTIGRIVFTYLDYLLLKQMPQQNFKFQFRNSIEHFYPQHPCEKQSGTPVAASNLHILGNLALVSTSANSKFSNSLPKAKAENFQTTIEAQSPKLQLMAQITRQSGAWCDEQVQSHHDAMVQLLRDDVNSVSMQTKDGSTFSSLKC